MKNKITKRNVRKIAAFAVCLAALLAAGIFGTCLTPSRAAESDFEGNVYYNIEAKNQAEAERNLSEAQKEVAKEAMILLKNEDNALPVAKASKVTVFGNAQNKTSVRAGRIDKSLEAAGLEVNPVVQSFYQSSAAPGRTFQAGNGQYVSGYQTFEAPVDTFTFTPETGRYADYHDAAFVVFSRTGGEGSDLPTRMAYTPGGTMGGFDNWDSDTPSPGARSADDHYLQLDRYETDLLDHVCANFDKVVVLLNMTNGLELGFLDDPGHYAYHPEIKAALWVGTPVDGTSEIGSIVVGDVNPSGHTVNTFVRDLKKDPTWQNYSKNLQADGNRYTYGSNNTAADAYFVHYEEGIYVGYRYYETRGYDEGLTTPYVTDGEGIPDINGTTTKNWDSWYTAHTVYPLGYGLSYTTFDWELAEQNPAEGAALAEDGKISVTVRVTNNGTCPGKDVVQLYYTAPYNPEHAEKAIEKSHVVLGGFEKTKMLEPGDSEDVTITMDVEAMKSYDYDDADGNGIRGYELEAGDYAIKVSRDAHTPLLTLNYSVPEDIYYDTDAATGNAVGNLFDDVSFNEYGVQKYMSRADFAGTFPTSGVKYKQVTRAFLDTLNMPVVNAEYDAGKPWHTDEPVAFAADNTRSDIKLNHLIGRDYDDPLWEAFLNQMTRAEMNAIPDHGFYETVALERLNKPATRDVDGPWGFGGTNTDGHGLSCLCGPMISQTYNRELAFLRAAAQAEAGYYGNRITGWYAPGMNIFRSAFSGRNNEYYGEDGFLSGIMASNEILGAKSKGMYTYAKHMFLNDQETNRDTNGIATWANEQSMRELYAKPFEISVKTGKVQAVMSSFNRIGVTPARLSRATLTGMLRNEWGFEGMVVTDWANGGSRQETDLMLRAGNDLRLGNGHDPSDTAAANTPTHERAIRNAVKNIMFTVCNSNAMNGVGVDWGEEVNALPLVYDDLRLTVIKGGSAANLTVGTATAAGKTDGITYAVAEGALPTGLSLNADGTLSGTPTGASGLYRVTVRASDTSTKYAYSFAPATAQISLILQEEGEELAVRYTGGALPDGRCGTAYNASVATATVQSSGDEKIVYRLAQDSALPEGLTMSKTGMITGLPRVAVGGFRFKVEASVADNDTWIPTQAEFTVNVTGRMFLNAREINVYKETAFERQLDLFVADTGGSDTVAFAVKTGTKLPDGVRLDPATGKLTGTVKASGTYTFTVTAAADGYTATEAVIGIVVHEFKYVTV